MHSAIFCGRLRHRRLSPSTHRFSYRLFMVYLDLAELETVFAGRWFWSVRRPALARFRREDHFGDPRRSLDDCVRELVEQSGAPRPGGPIRLLTHLSYFGYCFNPVSFYYCFDDRGREVEAIVAEVSNTPWGERFCYVLTGKPGPGTRSYRPRKRMHVSPFMPMDVEYDWRFRPPGRRLGVCMSISRQGSKVFDAALDLERVEIGAVSLARMLIEFPFMTARVILAIHWQALLLWLKKCPVYDHPRKSHLHVEEVH